MFRNVCFRTRRRWRSAIGDSMSPGFRARGKNKLRSDSRQLLALCTEPTGLTWTANTIITGYPRLSILLLPLPRTLWRSDARARRVFRDKIGNNALTILRAPHRRLFCYHKSKRRATFDSSLDNNESCSFESHNFEKYLGKGFYYAKYTFYMESKLQKTFTKLRLNVLSNKQ